MGNAMLDNQHYATERLADHANSCNKHCVTSVLLTWAVRLRSQCNWNTTPLAGGSHLPGCQLVSELLPLSGSKGAMRALSNRYSSLQLVDPPFQQSLQHTNARQ